MEPAEVRDARPYLGSWTAQDDSVARTLVVESHHRAVLDGRALSWKPVKPVPSRIPPPPSLAIDLPGGRTLTAERQGDALVTGDGRTHTRWSRTAP